MALGLRGLLFDLRRDIEMESLPIVDLSSPDRQANATIIVEAMETLGFLMFENIAGYDEDLHSHQVVLRLTRKMSVTRKKWNNNAKSIYRGYFPIDHESISYKEGYEFGPELSPGDPELDTAFPFVEHNVWPERKEGADEEPFETFHQTITSHFKAFFDASIDFMRLLALGLGLKENFFDHMFIPDTLSTLRLLCYPPRLGPPPSVAVTDDGTVLYCNDHADVGILTMLTSFNKPGLQIRRHCGTWMDVQSRPRTVIVNLGEMLSEMSGNRIKATHHRVVDTGGKRYSCPFLLEPGYFGRMSVSLPSTGDKGESKEKGETGSFVEYRPIL